jgi:hypothetical protein
MYCLTTNHQTRSLFLTASEKNRPPKITLLLTSFFDVRYSNFEFKYYLAHTSASSMTMLRLCSVTAFRPIAIGQAQ